MISKLKAYKVFMKLTNRITGTCPSVSCRMGNLSSILCNHHHTVQNKVIYCRNLDDAGCLHGNKIKSIVSNNNNRCAKYQRHSNMRNDGSHTHRL